MNSYPDTARPNWLPLLIADIIIQVVMFGVIFAPQIVDLTKLVGHIIFAQVV